MTHWTRVGLTDPCALTTERTVLHHAVQLLAAFGQALVEPRDDDAHRSTRWDPSLRAFRSESSDEGLQAVMSLAPLRLEVWRDGRPRDAVDLAGRTPDDALAWLESAVGDARSGGPVPLTFPDWDLPAREDGRGSLRVSDGAREEIARWYDNAHRLLTEIADRTEGASEVRCWPHHFDIATLVTYPPPAEGEEARYTGIGLSPGDADYPQPYLYVNASPAPDADTLQPLGGPGHWHTDGWTAAILPAERVVEVEDPAEQCDLVERFVGEALAEARRALGVAARTRVAGPSTGRGGAGIHGEGRGS